MLIFCMLSLGSAITNTTSIQWNGRPGSTLGNVLFALNLPTCLPTRMWGQVTAPISTTECATAAQSDDAQMVQSLINWKQQTSPS
jgi:hypothetical protein